MQLQDYLKLPYRVVMQDEGDHGWSVELPELPGCVAASDRREGLQAALEDAKRAWLSNALRHGDPIPLPHQLQTASTKAS